MTDDETMLRTALARTATVGEPPGSAVDSVFAKAGRMRARRRVGAGMLTVAGIAGVSMLFLNLGGGGQGIGVLAPAEPVASAAPVFKGLTAPQEVLANLIRLMPSTVTATEPFSQEGYGEIVAVDADGKTKVELNVQPLFGEGGLKPGPTNVDSEFDCATRALENPGDKCEAQTLADGTVVVVVTGTAKGIELRQVDVLTPGRLRVAVAVWNAADEKGGPVTRPSPVLTIEQLKAIALDPSWKA